MGKKIEILILFFVLIFAIGFRLFLLDKMPFELFGDEVDVGYHAYSILRTGEDYTGHFLPSYITSFSEPRASLFIYATVPFVAVFGLNEWGVRLGAMFFGVLDVFLIYIFIRNLFSNKALALIAAFVLAITPWHIQYSRISYEVTLLMALILSGTIFFFKGFKNHKWVIVSAILFALTFYTYSTASLFSPLLILLLVIIFRKQFFAINKRLIIASVLVGFVILLPFIKDTISGRTSDRFSKISIFSDQKTVNSILSNKLDNSIPERLFNNNITAYSEVFLSNYLKAFSPDFLFFSGDPNPRQSTRGMGELYLIYLPFILVGLYFAITSRRKSDLFLICWLILSPIPSALTQDGGNHATRLFVMLPPIIYFISLGFYKLLNVKKTLITVFLIILVSIFLSSNIASYLDRYYVHYPRDSWTYWQYGYKESMQYIDKVKENYDEILINNVREPALIRFLFWVKLDPVSFRKVFNKDQSEPQILPGFDGFKVGKYYFGHPSKDIVPLLNPNRLYLAFQGDEIPGDWNWGINPPEGVKVLKVINAPFSNNPYIYILTGEKK